MTRTLLKGGCVLSLDRKVGNFLRGDVLIEDDRIAEVGESLRARDAQTIDATDTIIMPGFVDTHRHVWKSLLRNLGAGRSPDEPSPSAAFFGRHYQPDDVYAATLIGLLGALEAGITTVVDWADISTETPFVEAALQAHADAGVRTVFVHSAPDRAPLGEAAIGSVRRLADNSAEAPGPLTSLAFGSGDLIRSDLGRITDEWALARELGLRIHAHAGLDAADEGVVSELALQGLLDSDVALIHCTKLADADLDAIASSGASVSLTPSTEMAGNLGAPPIQQFLDREIRLALGIDDVLLAPGDMFAQIRATISLQHATYFDLKLAGKAGLPNLLTTRDMIQYATVDGARAAGLDGEIGSLRPGKQADLVVLRTDRPNIYPINDPIGAVVWGMDTSNIAWVFAGGRAQVRDGVLEADVDRARRLATEAQRRVLEASGQAAGIGGGERS